MTKKIMLAGASTLFFTGLCAFLINFVLFAEDQEKAHANQALTTLSAIQKAAELKSLQLEQEIESLVGQGLYTSSKNKIKLPAPSPLLFVHVFEQSSRKSLWSWEGTGGIRLKPEKLAEVFGKQLFESGSLTQWLSLDNNDRKYSLVSFRRLLLFPKEKTEKEVTIVGLVDTKFWQNFAESFARAEGGLAILSSEGELLASSSPEVISLQRRLNSTGWSQQASSWQKTGLEDVRITSRAVGQGELWVINFSETASSFYSSLALFIVLLAFGMIIAAIVILFLPPQSEVQILADEKDTLTEESKEELTPVVIPRLNSDERLQLVRNIAKEVSRELIRPLTSILGHIQLSREAQKETLVEHLDKMETEARSARKFVESLRAVSGDLPKQPQKSSVPKVLDAQFRRLQWKIDDHRVQLKTDIQSQALVMGDQYALEDAFAALMNNAIESQLSKAERVVELKAYDHEGKCIVEISDKGEGIPEDIRARIYEPFFTTRKEEGHYGLGLSLARATIESQGGEFRLDSIEGEGTHIRIKFDIVGKEQSETRNQDDFVIKETHAQRLDFVDEAQETTAQENKADTTPNVPKLNRKVDQHPVKIRSPRENA